MGGGFHGIDWAILGADLVGTSILADRLAGRRQTFRDFFLGGRRLPWWAVSGSIVASEVSGVTFVALPAIAWAADGNYTYLMTWTGLILARVLIGLFIVPAYYRREIYSPYEFMGQRLGPLVDRVSTGLFFVGGFLAQGARLFLAALVLHAITRMGILPAIALLGGISVVWTWLGGINSVVWTDVVQFVILFVGAITVLVAVTAVVPGGAAEIARLGSEAGKFKVVDLTLDRTSPFTLWTGLFGFTFLTLASHGTDQMMAQRLFCCRDAAEARKAVIASSVAVILPVLLLTAGAGIYAYFRHFPGRLTPDQWAQVEARKEYLLPYFVLAALPVGVKGLLFAAIFSAATATSTLSAMAQTAVSSLVVPFLREKPDERRLIRLSRAFVLLSAAGLCAVAVLCNEIRQYRNLLDLALAMAGYTYGAMLGMLLLALLPFGRDARGLVWGVPTSMLLVFALSWQHHAWARATVAAGAGLLVAAGAVLLRREIAKLFWVLLGAGLVVAAAFAPWGKPPALAYPWHFPLGAIVTLGLGVALGRKRLVGPERPSV